MAEKKEQTKPKKETPKVETEGLPEIQLMSRSKVTALADAVDIDFVISRAKLIIDQYRKAKAQGIAVSTYIRASNCKRVFGASMRTIQRYKEELAQKGWQISQSSIPKNQAEAGTTLVHIVPVGWKEE